MSNAIHLYPSLLILALSCSWMGRFGGRDQACYAICCENLACWQIWCGPSQLNVICCMPPSNIDCSATTKIENLLLKFQVLFKFCRQLYDHFEPSERFSSFTVPIRKSESWCKCSAAGIITQVMHALDILMRHELMFWELRSYIS